MRDRRSMLHWLLIYGLLSLLFAGSLLWPGNALYRWDTLIYTWPFLQEAKAQILAGRWPFWASSLCCGTPLLENINLGLLYPPRALIWFLPLRVGYQLLLFVHVVLSFWCMHLLLQRGFRLRALPAFVGALAFGAAGYLRSMWDTHNFAVVPWIPLGFALLLEAERPRGGRRGVLGVGLAWTLMILSGEFQAACLWWPLALLLALFRPARRKLVPVLLSGTTLAILLTAPQWLPTVQATAESYRAGGLSYADAVERSFHPLRLIELLVPYAFGNRDQWWGAALAGQGATKLSPWITSFHIGILPALLAVWSLRRIRRSAVRWSLVVTAGGLLLSLGRFLPGYRFWLDLPVVGAFRYPEKYLLWPTFGLAVLAAVGAARGAALLRRRRAGADLCRRLPQVMLALSLLLALMGVVVPYMLPGFETRGAWWLAWRLVFAVMLLLAVALLFRERRARLVVWALLVVFDLAAAWRVEQPVTRAFDPLQAPALARAVQSRDEGQGRILRDRVVQSVPMPEAWSAWRPAERQATFYRESLLFNSARLWGLRTAEGFSPAESSAMRAFRLSHGAPEDERAVPATQDLETFCRRAAVTWLFTSPARLQELRERGDRIEQVAAWGDPPAVVLGRRLHVVEAEADVAPAAPQVVQVWRARPGVIRVDLRPGTAESAVRVSETFARGWQARDETGARLVTEPAGGAFLGVRVPPGVTQIRLLYAPPAWRMACCLALLGLVVGVGVLISGRGREEVRGWLHRLGFILGASLALAMVIGLAARAHWACSYDEGYHVARGLAQVRTQDSRLAYFHPPLQNLLSGYFADQAFGDRVRMPNTVSWEQKDAHGFAVELAYVNADLYGELIRASRWGSAVFLALLVVVGVVWAWRLAGSLAAWLAGLGLALNPNLLAHGNLSTTDIGLTALVLAGTFALWHYTRDRRPAALALTVLAFVASALVKHTGLIWLLAFWLLVVPLLAWQLRSRRFLLLLLIVPLVFVALLMALYGPEAQVLRLAPGVLGDGWRFPAASYVEGLWRQTQHVLEGHRAYFAGATHREGSWWQLPAALVLKTPLLGLLAALPAGWGLLRQLRRPEWSITLCPALVFLILLLTGNKMTVGVRHVLPYVAFLAVGGSVWAARLRAPTWRTAVALLLAGSGVVATAFSYPHLISYFPSWAGGLERGHRWLVDNNYDWGQEADALEEQWAGLTAAHAGVPPNLVYFGFIDPSALYRLPVGPASLRGYMGWRYLSALPPEARQATLDQLRHPRGVTVASVSALALDPFGLDLSALRAGTELGSPGLTFRLLRTD